MHTWAPWSTNSTRSVIPNTHLSEHIRLIVYIQTRQIWLGKRHNNNRPNEPDENRQPVVGQIDDVNPGYAIPTCHCRPCHRIRNRRASAKSPWEGYDFIFPEKHKTLDDQRYLLCPRRLYGLILKSRTWGKRLLLHVASFPPNKNATLRSRGILLTFLLVNIFFLKEQLDVAHCSDVKTNNHAFNSLVLHDPRTMGILKALVYKYSTGDSSGNVATKTWSADFIENKGEGQIFLLHGSPGVGKTYVRLTLLPSLPEGYTKTSLNVLLDSRYEKPWDQCC